MRTATQPATPSRTSRPFRFPSRHLPRAPIHQAVTTTGFFARTLHRLRRGEGGFSLMETVVALGVLFISLLVLARTAAVGFTDIAMSRQRQQANQLANQILEQVRGLTYARVGQGLETSDLSGDSNIVTCSGVRYYLNCPASDPDAEIVAHSDNPADDVPLVPHRRTFGISDGYTTTYTASVYVTEAKLVPSAGAFRVTAHVSWTPAQRAGVNNFVTTQSLLYTPEGTTDATTGGGTSPFFYGTGSIGRAPVTLTPNPGVAGGVGLQGLPTWDSMTVNLYGLESSLQQQALTRTESKVVLTGASKVVSGVETLAGGDTAEAIADNDPATTPTTSSAPGSLMQSTVTSEISGGGQTIEAEAASGTLAPACPTKSIVKMSGMETGNRVLGTTHEFNGYTGAGTIFDTAVKQTGAYSLKIAPTTNTSGFAMNLPGGSGNDRYGVMHFAFRFASLPTADIVSLASFDQVTSTSEAGLFGYNASTNRFQVRHRNASNVLQPPVQASSTVTAGQWYSIDLKYDLNSSTHKLDWSIDGVPQTQATMSGSGALFLYAVSLGTRPVSAPAFTANYDDFALSVTPADYPIGDIRIGRLMPNAVPSWSFANGAITNNGGTAVTNTSWNRLDEIPMTSSTDYIVQVNNDTAGHVVVGFEDTSETCILAARGHALLEKAAGQAMHGRTEYFEGATPTLLRNGDHTVAGSTGITAQQLAPTGGTWDTTKLNGVTVKLGYSSDANPDAWWQSFQIQYAYMAPGGGSEGAAGTETGSTASTTAASAGTPCGTPTQIDGRACTYAWEDYSTAGPPHLSLKAGTTGSDEAMARLYRFSPSTQAGSISYVWGRRAAGGGGVGTVKETVVRYPGTHTFAPLPTFMGGSPAGWLGYWLKYDAGTSASSVSAEAGIGATAPSYTSAGTISYWNGTGYLSMAPPAAGGEIPLTAVDFTSGGYRVQISGSLATSPSFTSQVPAGASGTADRNEGRATLGAPVSGTFTYKITYVATAEVVGDLTMSVDLGSLTATARYAP